MRTARIRKLELTTDLEPARRHLIERPRLTRLLDEATAPVIMLVAPAGFGKTTLARQWLASRRHGWYRGSPASADVAALAVGLARSASAVVPGAGRRMEERLRATGTPEQDVEPLAELLAEDLAQWPPDAWLAFDDYQFACESSHAERFVERVLALSPLRLFLTTRTRPSWATSRRLLYGEAYEVSRSLLAMSQDEAEQVLSHRKGTEASAILALADGWPAVIGLAALARDFDPPESGVPDALYAYFAEELYQAAEPDLQWSLSQLALSSSVAAAVAEALLGEKAEYALEEGLRLGFLVRTDEGEFEIHPLLRGFLEEKFREQAADRAPAIVERLVRTHMDRAEWDEAYSLLERFFDGELLVELFEAALPAMLLEARLPTLTRWVEYAVTRRVDAPVIDLAEGELAFRAGDRARSEALALQATRRLGTDHPLNSRGLSLAGVSAHLAHRDEIALEYFARAHEAAPDSEAQRQALWGRFLSTIALEQEPAAALAEFEARSTSAVDDLLRLGNGRLLLGALEGGFRDALEAARQLAPLFDRSRDPLVQSSFLNSYASGLALAGRYEEAVAVTDQEIAHAEEYRLEFVLPHAHIYKATALWGLRRFRQCLLCLDQAQRSNRDPRDGLVFMNIGAVRARVQLGLGSAERALDALGRYEHDLGPRGMKAEYRAWWSLVLACANEREDALMAIEDAEALSGRLEVSALVPWTRAILALSENRRDGPSRARSAFRFALEAGNVDAIVSAYRGCPPILRALAAEPDDQRDLMRVLLQANDQALGRSAGLKIRAPNTKTTQELLSKREREVLDLLVQGATNREIAKALFITEGTAKVHTRRIYAKLGVRSRTEAVVRALEDEP